MVYIKNWTDFESAATDLYARSPDKVRYCVKFQPKTGHLVLKITDDLKCLKYKTFSSIILNRFDSLNLRLLTSMSNTRARPKLPTTSATETPEREGTPAPAAAGADEQSQAGQTQSNATAGGQAQGQGASNSGGNKKKKKKGKK
ncbi:hypothetical protein L202_06861 [Cryptococcus amylolentus CBS 6039]|uniref:SRP9 domain-containing protein n=2 Tax=Cryptococcus amylolentus TaxID=104669 RepID=A0A1E3HFD7_9TREE|nr:hypothetical protein L202_06861 [Cryptococcus amylolentus CBS 6039]ODN74476.1 hypothetical protein L202_06861 [Cryptococcus amylolentus CBS 6039]ODO01466.1 hypothetical protein I350_06286 [Cryptococcus amylolentus CBS 6273]